MAMALKKYLGWTSREAAQKKYADLDLRFSSYNTKAEGLVGDSVADDRLALHTLANVTMQPNGGQLDIVGIPRIASDVTIPSNVRLRFVAGAYLAPDVGVTVTINGNFDRTLEKKFGGGGAILFGPGKVGKLRPQWWGCILDGATDDTNGWKALIVSLGDTTTMRYGKVFQSGPSVISDTLLFDRKSVELYSIGKGGGFIWNGPDNIPMVKFKRVWMVSCHHLRFLNKHASNRPSACIEINVTTGDSPAPTRFSLSHLTIGGDGFDPGTTKTFRAGIVTSGDNLQCDQSVIDNLSLQSCDDYGIRIEDTQNVFWAIRDSSINAGPTAKGISTAAKYTTLDTVFFQTNLVDIEIVNDGAVEGTNLGSELSGKFVLAATAGNFTCKGGYWQYNSVNQNADGKIIDMQGGVLLQLDHFRFTNRGEAAITQKIWLRGQDVTARFLDMDYLGASWTAFLDVATTGATQTRHIEVLGRGAFRNAWTHGDNINTVDALRFDLSPNQFIKQEVWQVPALQNNWVNFDGVFSPWGCYKDKNGQVWLRGFIKDGTAADGTLLATLPVGYRPGFKAPVLGYNNASATPQRYQIAANGEIKLDGLAAGPIALDGISFRAV
jgi:hypothetical protein